MREILFRGKWKNSGEWVYGNLFNPDKADTPTQICIGTYIARTCYEIDPETVGQFTGLTDKNGKKIFEGDIIIFNRGRNLPNTKPRPLPVFWDERNAQFTLYESPFAVLQKDMMHECEVIGNIHDNPELLKGD